MVETKSLYPASLTIDYPDRKLNKLTTFFRIFTVIPIALIMSLITGAVLGWTTGEWSWQYAAGGLVFLPLVLMILFRKKYPRWWYDWNLALTRFSARIEAYLLLLRDEYPSTDEEQAVHIEIPYPDTQTELGRGWPLIKWFLAIPHYIVLCFLYVAVMVVTIIAWFAILFTGMYPRGLFVFVVGVMRWSIRVMAYTILLTTDRYPPFSLA